MATPKPCYALSQLPQPFGVVSATTKTG